MAKNREIQVFGLSFMDLISCGLGGMLVLMFVFSTLVNAEGVAQPSKAKSSGKTMAQLERAMIFNTHFVLKVVLEEDDDSIAPLDHIDLVQSSGTRKSQRQQEFVFMIQGDDRVVKKMTFKLKNYQSGGTVQLLGKPFLEIPENTRFIEVLKDKTNYQIQFVS